MSWQMIAGRPLVNLANLSELSARTFDDYKIKLFLPDPYICNNS